MPVVHINPAQEEDVKAMIRRLETEPELKKRYDAIMMKKREEWRAREADRKLVG
jgi:asparagine synthetase B (glutamine-hydrolysing)